MINGGTGDFWEYSLLGVLDAVGFGNSNKDDWIDDGEMRLFLLLQNVPIIGFKGKPLFFSDMSLVLHCFFRFSSVFQDVVHVAADATDAPPPLEATCDV